MAVISNLYVDTGYDYCKIITVTQPNGNPFNLTDYTVKSQMRKSYASSQSFDFLADIYNAEAGQIRLKLAAADTELIPPGRWLYDVEITHATGAKRRVTEGLVIVTPQITKI